MNNTPRLTEQEAQAVVDRYGNGPVGMTADLLEAIRALSWYRQQRGEK